jgi:hypothetical protein
MRFPLFILLLAFVTAHAAETTSRSCRILFLNGPSDAPKTLHLFDGVSSQEVELPQMNFSPVYEIRSGALTLAMLPSPPVPRAGTTPDIPAEAPKATLTETITDFYLILSSDLDNKVAPVKIQVVNADVSNFKRGQMLWYNLTDTKVGGILGSRKLLIEPNSRLILDAPANGLEDYYVNIHFQPPGKTRAEPLCETRWTHDPRSRSVSFILKPASSLIPRILGFSDFRTEKNSKPEAAP